MSELRICACMGPILGQPHCPCKMQQLGLSDGKEYDWPEERKAQFMDVIRDMVDSENSGEKSHD